jgi:hypothetical protein
MEDKTVKKHEAAIVKVIKKNNLFNIVDIFAYYSGCCRATFYNHGMDKLDSIIKAIDENKVKTKQSLKNKWYKSDNPTLQIALYKCICTDEERQALSQNYTDITSKGNQVGKIEVEVIDKIQDNGPDKDK